MLTTNIRPVSDLKADFDALDSAMQAGPIVFTKGGYGAAVMMSIAEYERLADPMEALMEETDRIAKSDPRRFTGQEVYERIKGSIRHVREAVRT